MAWIAPIVAAADQQKREETLLAELVAQDKEDKYEFKVLKGYLGAFRKPERLQQVLEEERRAQWEMVIKLDDERLILRRPRRAQTYDAIGASGTDPYRTQIGGAGSAVGQKIAVLLGLLVLAAGAGLFFIMRGGSASLMDGVVWSPIAAIVVTILVVMMVFLKRSRR